MSTCTYTELYN